MNTKLLRISSLVLFFLGVLTGLALAVIAIWNNIEATNYFFRGVKYAPFGGLRCPLLIAPTEKGTVTAVFNNPTDGEDRFLYRAEISREPFSTRQVDDQVAVPTRQSKNIQLTVDAQDVDLRFFILVKLTVLPNSVHPSQEAVCGVMVANLLGLTGAQITNVALLVSFLGMAVGLGLWQQTSTAADYDRWRLMQALGLVVIFAMVTAALGWWILAIALAVITILLLVISLRFAVA